MIKQTSSLLPIILMAFISTNAYAKEDAQNKAMSEDAVDSQFDNNKKICEQKKDFEQEVCITQAEGDRDVAKAKLKATVEPTLENEVDYRVAIAEAKYTLSIKKCQTSNTRPSCMHKAQVLRDKETEDAREVRK